MANPRQRLIAYMEDFFGVTRRPGEHVAISLEQIAEFCDLLRAGCQQDIVRLIKKLIFTDSGELEQVNGVEALTQFGMTMNEGNDIRLWGLNDCKCDRVDCVYCGRRIAKRATSAIDVG